jgi:hypothetical protein
VVVIMHRLQIHQQRRLTVQSQSRSRQQSSLQAVPFTLSQRALRRPRCVPILIGQRVKESLDSSRRLQRAQDAQIPRRQSEALMSIPPNSVFQPFLTLQRPSCDSLGKHWLTITEPCLVQAPTLSHVTVKRRRGGSRDWHGDEEFAGEKVGVQVPERLCTPQLVGSDPSICLIPFPAGRRITG